ncbi:MAG: hypothetical protein HOV79_27870 [Hamadaea sp.]|nr:hypothetical protein [Hamadaea sp.]
MRRFVSRFTAVAAVLAVVPSAVAPPVAQAAGAPVRPRSVLTEMFHPDGAITPISVTPPAGDASDLRTFGGLSATVTPVEVNGPSENRIDIVYVGDGYTEADLAAYAAHVSASWDVLRTREPFLSYRSLFNVWRVDVVSAVSGVSGDPTPDVVRDTPLGMAYWCAGLERLLCADIERVRAFASLAPDADQIAAVANSPKYGGAGYTEDEVVTFSGGHSAGPEIFPHELGHSLGDLADEYPYWAVPGDGSTYNGPDPAAVNVTKFDGEQITSAQKKWWQWLGAPTPDGGDIGMFEGGNYTEIGIYRPSDNSLMRTLRRQFNAVSREKMVQSFYATVRPVDAASPAPGPVDRSATVSLDLIGVPLSVRWFVDGREVEAWRDRTSVDLAGLAGGAHHLAARVVDQTSWVRDADYRATYLTQQLDWQVRA